MRQEKEYDIFISYRRNASCQYARILKDMLSERGYKVFLDYDDLVDKGHFFPQLKRAAASAPIFMPILSNWYLQGCRHEDDWVRQGLLYAIENNKHIIPINPNHQFHYDSYYDTGQIPSSIINVLGMLQQSDILFSSDSLEVSVDFLVHNRIMPIIGKRKKRVSIHSIRNSLSAFVKHIKTKQNETKSEKFDIFIAYRRSDCCGKAQHLYDLLQIYYKKRIKFVIENFAVCLRTDLVYAAEHCKDYIIILGENSLQYSDINDNNDAYYKELCSLPYKQYLQTVCKMEASLDYFRLGIGYVLRRKERINIIPIVPEPNEKYDFKSMYLPDDIKALKEIKPIFYSTGPDALFKDIIPPLRKAMVSRPDLIVNKWIVFLILLFIIFTIALFLII